MSGLHALLLNVADAGGDFRSCFSIISRMVKTVSTPLPLGTHGFLYFAPGPAHAPLAGEFRFRVTADADPAGFAAGRDLELPRGTVWSIPLLRLARSKAYTGAVVLLERDGHVSAADNRRWREDAHLPSSPSSPIIYASFQPFRVNLGTTVMRVWVTAGDSMHKTQLQCLFSDWRRSYGLFQPYQGEVLCHFEYALSKTGDRTAMVRVASVLGDVTCVEGYTGDLPMPLEGGLVLKRNSEKPWSYTEGKGKPSLDLLIKQAFAV